MKILPDCFDNDVVIEWGVYDEHGNYVASFDSFEEAEEFVNA